MKRGKKLAAVLLTAVLAAGTFAGCGIDPDAVAVTIGGGEDTLSLGYVNFVAKYTQAAYDLTYRSYMGDDMWSQDLNGTGNTFEEDVKSDVMDSLQEEYLLMQHAGDYGIELTEEETAAIQEAADQFMADNDEDAMDQMGATSEYVRTMLTYQTYANRVSEAIRAQAQPTVTEEEARMRTFTYAYFDTTSTTDEDGTSRDMTDEEKQEQREMAELLTDPSNFNLGASSSGATVNTYSYNAGDTGMDEAILSAADALNEGEVSSVIETDDGYYVIRLDSANDVEQTQTKLEELQNEQRDEYLQQVLDGWKEDTPWEVDESQWAKVVFDVPFSEKGTEE